MPFDSNKINAKEFGTHDDWVTCLLFDKLGFSPTIRKFTDNYRSLTIPEEDIDSTIPGEKVASRISKEIASALEAVTKEANHLESTARILDILRQHGYHQQLSKPIEFEAQLDSYVQIYLPDCPFDINITYQYSSTGEACVTARRPIDGGIIKYLFGYLVVLKEGEEDDLIDTGRDFSVFTSSRNRSSLLFLGPGRFVNHDCDGNAKLQQKNNRMHIIATRYIQVGEEITVKYGNDYFGKDNREPVTGLLQHPVYANPKFFPVSDVSGITECTAAHGRALKPETQI
ncbi:hypothetical protein GQ44DRAFT_825120 [Phaeosphaeriaceae sp. PMI808]|nr:hypothetical protein GQ44DRAFT_825120 [Phaeosphaeriaceae sp. PMI808]